MKTQFSQHEVSDFLAGYKGVDPKKVEPLVEGHISQAFKFEVQSGEYAIRIADTDKDFKADAYAYGHFGYSLPIPAVRAIERFEDTAYCCITDLAPGLTASSLSSIELKDALPSIQEALASIFLADIGESTGFGHLDVTTGNASFKSLRDYLLRIEEIGREHFVENAKNIGLDTVLVGRFFKQFRTNLNMRQKQGAYYMETPGSTIC